MSDTVHKSYHVDANQITTYCSELSIKQTDLQKELQATTLRECEMARMLGAPEVLTLGCNFIELIGAKKIIDIGTFTGASALAWAQAAGEGSKIYTLDVDHSCYKKYGVPIISKCSKLTESIVPIEGSAIATLDKFIAEGKAGTFDFVFIDADKVNYSNYYNKSMELLRKGGVILVDNALWSGRAANPSDEASKQIDACNRLISKDPKSNSSLVNCGDGLHIAFKK